MDLSGRKPQLSKRFGLLDVTTFHHSPIPQVSHDGPPVLAIAVEDERKEKDYRGILLHSSSSLTDMVRVAKDNGFRLEIHCIGDKAAEQTLSALEEAGCSSEDRPVMTHCQVLSPGIIQRMKDVGAIANVQPSFVPTDMRSSPPFLPCLTPHFSDGSKSDCLPPKSRIPTAGRPSSRFLSLAFHPLSPLAWCLGLWWIRLTHRILLSLSWDV